MVQVWFRAKYFQKDLETSPTFKMVSRRTTKFSHLAEQESITSFLRSENQSLRKKNEDLAKALSEAKMEQQKLVQTTFELQKRLHLTDTENLKYEEFLRAQSMEMQNYIQQFLLLTEKMTTMLGRTKMVAQSPQVLDRFINSPSSEQNLSTSSTHSNKTMAVMPMISGHTILSPKVNLPRVTVKQLTDMMYTNNSEHIENANMETDEIEFADNVSSNQEDLSERSFENNSVRSNQRLETLHEVDDVEEEQTSISNSQPLLSGVFKDIQVFISPLSPQHLIKFKHKTPRKFKQNTFSTTSSSSVTTLANSTGDNSTSIKSSMSRSDSTTDNSENETLIKNSTTPLPINLNNLSSTNTEDYDPMEGPSNLWRYTPDVNSTIFKPTPNETSTPYSPKIPQKSPGVSSDESGTPRMPLKHVTRRKASSRSKTVSSKLSNCCVRVQKLSQNTLNSLLSSKKNDTVSPKKSASMTRMGREIQSLASSSKKNETISPRNTRRRRDDSPTVLERSRRSSGGVDLSERKSSSFASPKVRRTRRRVTPGSYKEPSLIKKMRR